MLLINPVQRDPLERFGGMLSRYVGVIVPMSVGSIAGYLMKHGVRVKVVDEEMEWLSEENIERHLQGLEKPYIFGISCLTAHASRVYELSTWLKGRYPDSTVILGGLHVTALPEEALSVQGVDYVVRGEGEEILLNLIRAIRDRKDASHLEGISFRDPRTGEFIHNPDAPLIQNLDEIPIFPYHLFDNPRYDMGFVMTARGCPYKCTYCSQRLLTGLTYRWHSPDSVMQMLDIVINRYGSRYIALYDDNFSFNKRRVKELCDAIVAHGFHRKAEFNIQTRADNFYEDIMPYLKRANFTSVGFGMETGVERLAQVIQKGQTVKTHIEAVHRAHRNGMRVALMMMFGLPTETREDRIATYKLVRDLGVNMSKTNNTIPYPGTPMYEPVKDDPKLYVERYWKNFNSTLSITRSIFNTTTLPFYTGSSEYELKRDIIFFNLRLYLRPKTVLSILRGEKDNKFVVLPERWYLKPKEVVQIAKIGTILGTNLLVAMLPLKVGQWIVTKAVSLRRRFEPADRHARYDINFPAISKRVLPKRKPVVPAAAGAPAGV